MPSINYQDADAVMRVTFEAEQLLRTCRGVHDSDVLQDAIAQIHVYREETFSYLDKKFTQELKRIVNLGNNLLPDKLTININSDKVFRILSIESVVDGHKNNHELSNPLYHGKAFNIVHTLYSDYNIDDIYTDVILQLDAIPKESISNYHKLVSDVDKLRKHPATLKTNKGETK